MEPKVKYGFQIKKAKQVQYNGQDFNNVYYTTWLNTKRGRAQKNKSYDLCQKRCRPSIYISRCCTWSPKPHLKSKTLKVMVGFPWRQQVLSHELNKKGKTTTVNSLDVKSGHTRFISISSQIISRRSSSNDSSSSKGTNATVTTAITPTFSRFTIV